MEDVWFRLNKKAVVFLFAYLFLLLMVGIFTSFTILWNESNSLEYFPVMTNAILGSIGFSLVGCCIFYIRKLYKACINKDVKVPEKADEQVQEIGVFMYFFMRPIYAIVFSLLVIISIKESVLIMVVQGPVLAHEFIYFSMILSFFAGFSAGDVVTILTKVGGEKISKIFN
jgi:hypothetical protein